MRRLFTILVPALVSCTLITPTILWQQNITTEAYWYGSVTDSLLYAGTFGLKSCFTDVFDISTGKHVSNIPKVCHIDALGADFGGVGFESPSLIYMYNTSGQVYHHNILNYYFALGEYPVILRKDAMFLFGDNKDTLPPPLRLACMYHVASAGGKLIRGPCLRDFGEGESADVSLKYRCMYMCTCLFKEFEERSKRKAVSLSLYLSLLNI